MTGGQRGAYSGNSCRAKPTLVGDAELAINVCVLPKAAISQSYEIGKPVNLARKANECSQVSTLVAIRDKPHRSIVGVEAAIAVSERHCRLRERIRVLA